MAFFDADSIEDEKRNWDGIIATTHEQLQLLKAEASRILREDPEGPERVALLKHLYETIDLTQGIIHRLENPEPDDNFVP